MIDAEVGRILDCLDALGLAGETIVVFTTDHGDMAGSHGGMIDKGYPYQEAHHIPLSVSWPGHFAPGRRSEAMVYNMDIFPTLLEAAGLPAPECDGRSFLPALEGRPVKGREEIYLEFHGLRFLYSQRALVCRDGWKYIFTPGDTDEVYDLDADPHEMNNRLRDPACAGMVERLRGRMLKAAFDAGDPLAPCIAKYFGRWSESPAPGHFDATVL